jgi:predicted ester cyclase
MELWTNIMSNNENNETSARRLFEEVWQDHNYQATDELVAKDYVLHDRSMPQGTEWASGPDGYRLMAEMWHGFFDGPVELDQLIPAGEFVVLRWSQTGKLVGEMGSIEPTDEEVTITGIEINRFEDGKIAETWQETGMIPMLTQIGVIPEDLFAPKMPAGN